MRLNSFVIALVLVIGVNAFTQTASGYYHPGLGRYMSRDPIGDLVTLPQAMPLVSGTAYLPRDPVFAADAVMQDAMNTAATKTAAKLGPTYVEDATLWKYADGMNLHEYLQSNPLRTTDPSGLQANPPSGLLGKELQLGFQLASAGATLIAKVEACNQCALQEPKENGDANWVAPPAIGPIPVYIRQVFIIFPYNTKVTWTPLCARRNCGELYATVFYKMPGKTGVTGFAYVQCR